ncbi:MAG: extracellular solute-binding protein [Solirubrobacterales bacterium]|nr:extracellular solute-binding protein [Solirubrobacterales bacterium]
MSSRQWGSRWVLTVASLILAASLAVSGCGGDGDGVGGAAEEEVSVATAEGEPGGDLTISNWALYIDKNTVGDFERDTGISLDYVEDVNSYDEFFGKMQPLLERGDSGGRSLMVAGDWLAKKMYDLGYIQKLDKGAKAPAFEHLNPDVKPPSSDPNWDFSIPWQGGMTGLIVNKEEAPDVNSINDLFDPRYKGRVEVLSELRETVPLVMKADGVDPDTATTDDWLAAIDKLGEAGQSGQLRRFTGADYAKDLVTGDAVAVIGWAADAIQLQADNPQLEWRMPAEGCMVWWDDWVIPAGAPNPTAAYEWINYTYEPKNQAQIVAWTSAVTPVAGVQEIFEKTDPEAARSELIFPSAEYTKDCSTPINPPGGPEEQQRVESAWRVATGA